MSDDGNDKVGGSLREGLSRGQEGACSITLSLLTCCGATGTKGRSSRSSEIICLDSVDLLELIVGLPCPWLWLWLEIDPPKFGLKGDPPPDDPVAVPVPDSDMSMVNLNFLIAS